MGTGDRLVGGGSADWGSTRLWHALDEMQIEPQGAGLTFCARLARDNGWSRRYAKAVLEEYKRFLFLAAHSPQPLTPSHEVDQAWHLHLLYSRHYWDVMCGEILERPLHHGPTAGGMAEGARYRHQYEETLERYRAVFGNQPPASIWPPCEIRFAPRGSWVDRQSYWLVPKALAGRGAAAGGAALLAACSAVGTGSSSVWLGFAGLLIVIVLIAVFALVSARDESRKDKGDGCGGGAGCGSSGSDGSGGDAGCGGGGCGGCGS